MLSALLPSLALALAAASSLPPGPERSEARLSANLADERALKAFDINAASVSFSLLGDLEGTTMMLKVSDERCNPVGVFKPTNGSTYHRAELAAYRLAVRFGLPVYPATVVKTLDRRGLEGFRALLRRSRFEFFPEDPVTGHYRQKERNRVAMLERLEGLESLEGVLKAWVSPLIFYYELGTAEGIKQHPLYPHLLREGPRPEPGWVDIEQCTLHFEPKGCLEAKMDRVELLRQFTGILLIDAILGNRDRLAGGNLHVRSRTGKLLPLGGDRYAIAFPELLSLDNGASLQEEPDTGMRVIRDLRLGRFASAHREAVYALSKELESDPGGVMASLGLEQAYTREATYEPMKIVSENVAALVVYLEGLGDDASFQTTGR